ncbi:response regulator [Roseomonas indoligenes]|uniref:Response regulator n=1 Tax=Roseomonas indoligenes TaxID=2820811 RepID=A0A940SAS1_9PROT|nr:response regulator [Pararoseomonas indoligenes]MBP0496482.1 response regulator [Pararoseomonas indoligenes]
MLAAVALAGRRVLVVENNYWIATEIEDWLLSAGADVAGPVASVADAMEAITAGGTPDAAVLDVNLREGELVYPLALWLHDHRVPFLFATGVDRIGDHPTFRDRQRLWKPLVRHELLQAISHLIGPWERQVRQDL